MIEIAWWALVLLLLVPVLLYGVLVVVGVLAGRRRIAAYEARLRGLR